MNVEEDPVIRHIKNATKSMLVFIKPDDILLKDYKKLSTETIKRLLISKVETFPEFRRLTAELIFSYTGSDDEELEAIWDV